MAWAPDYVTLDAQKNYLRIYDSTDDDDLAVAITAASRAIDDHCNRQFGQADSIEDRRYTARPDYERGVWVVDIDDTDDSSDLLVTIGGETVTDYTLEPVNAIFEGKVYTRIAISADSTVQPTGEVNEVTAATVWGWSDFPIAVVHAARLQTSRFFSRRNSPYGIAGSPDQGSEMRLLSRVDPDVGVSLRGYRRQRAVS